VSAAGGTISVLVGAVLLRLTVTGAYTRYVKSGMGPWLVVAGVVVIVLGVATLVRAWRGDGDGDGDRDEQGHEHGERVGWLLLAPIAALLLVAPPALGSFGVDRGASVDVREGAPEFQPLDPDAGPVDMTLLEFSQRAFDHDGASLGDTPVRLTGFVAGGGGFRLARYQIACCAADAAPLVVRVVGTEGGTPARDQWVTVTGTYEDTDGGDIAELAATSVVEIPEPTDPYE
jgi:uncharacterized repeat protein (TIGR03943 family)